MLFTTLVLQDYPQKYILSYFFKLLRVLSLFRMLAEFSLTCIFHYVWGRIFNLQLCQLSHNELESPAFWLPLTHLLWDEDPPAFCIIFMVKVHCPLHHNKNISISLNQQVYENKVIFPSPYVNVFEWFRPVLYFD